MEFTLYHNPRCKKSREALQFLEEKGIRFKTVKYLDQKLDPKALAAILSKINLKPSEILRKNELLWKKDFSSKNLNEDQILQLLIENPKLIERPIVTGPESGVLARTLENLVDFIKGN